jgi:hypothetical protein
MPAALASMRGDCLNWRLAVKGIQYASMPGAGLAAAGLVCADLLSAIDDAASMSLSMLMASSNDHVHRQGGARSE